MSGTREPNHYERLGVAMDAHARDIRAAYLRLMKASHPDRQADRAAGSRGADEEAIALNIAWHVLRDPRRRLAYDLTLQKPSPGRAPSGPRLRARPARGGLWRRTRDMLSFSRPAVLAGLLVASSIAACLVILASDRPRPLPPATVAAYVPEPLAEPDETQLGPWVDRAMVDRAVDHLFWLQSHGRTAEVSRYSDACFMELKALPNPLLVDHCIAFDLAAYRARSPDGESEIRRELELKHLQALRALASPDQDLQPRLRELDTATVSSMVRRTEEERRRLGAIEL